MHQQPSPARIVWQHRRELALSLLLITLATTLVALTPPLLVVAILQERRPRRRSRPLRVLRNFWDAAAWSWRQLLRLPGSGWHPCEQCGFPIEPPSRARFCSAACRRYGRLRRLAASGDEQAAARYDRLRRLADLDPALTDPVLGGLG
jgi:hypothetical protein